MSESWAQVSARTRRAAKDDGEEGAGFGGGSKGGGAARRVDNAFVRSGVRESRGGVAMPSDGETAVGCDVDGAVGADGRCGEAT